MSKFKLLQITMLSFFFITQTMAQNVYHVKTNGNDNNDGLKWSTAFKTIQAALDEVEAGDTIWVASGIYVPTKKYAEEFKDKTPTTRRTCSFIIPDKVVVMGGFPANPSDATGLSSRDWKANETILSGDLSGDDDYGYHTENAYHVVVMFDASPQTVLDGFSICGGYSDEHETAYHNEKNEFKITYGCGAGIYSFSFTKNASPTLRNLLLYDNYASYEGGGLFNYAYLFEASPEISNVEFFNNSAISKTIYGGRGGGLLIEGAKTAAKLTNVIISGNTSLSERFSYGGGAYFNATDDCIPILQNVLVYGNVSNAGAGLHFFSLMQTSAPTLTNVTISGNKAIARNNSDGYSDASMTVFSEYGMSSPIIQNTVICDNAGDKESEIIIASGEEYGKGINPTYSNSFIKGKTLGSTNLPGNTVSDLMFANPGSAAAAPFTNKNYQLRLESPLINKGNNSFITLSEDLAGQNRVYGGTVDIGAYESQGTVPSYNDNVDDVKNVWSSGNILYVNIDAPSSLRVYSISGALVKQIDNLAAGSHEFILPEGLYIVTLRNRGIGKGVESWNRERRGIVKIGKS